MNERRLLVDAARLAHQKHEDKWREQLRACDKLEGQIADADAIHTEWTVASSMGEATTPEPPTKEKAQAKLKSAEGDKEKLRNLCLRLEDEIKEREGNLSSARLQLNRAKAEVLKPVLAQLCQRYEAAIDEAIRIRYHIHVVSAAAAIGTLEHIGFSLSGTDKQVAEDTTDTRNALTKLAMDADADLSCILKPFKAPLKNGHAT